MTTITITYKKEGEYAKLDKILIDGVEKKGLAQLTETKDIPLIKDLEKMGYKVMVEEEK